MMRKCYPFARLDVKGEDSPIMQGRVNEVLRSWNLPPFDPIALNLLSKMLCVEAKRWKVRHLLRHPFFSMYYEPEGQNEHLMAEMWRVEEEVERERARPREAQRSS